ncbi:hypothetical protein [Bacillus sp. AFS017336]|uniref:hypothetical protein n=1 Tax=Bacillus sp. AFS017336 TaxID=2033489 RepID=UPI000BEF98A8|nr:hypothetical protein [Bacillus sp. AFS017336]PEL12684.1 hypothetical protein CN601_06980 [Bacillus sp. AFS017336]
METCLYPGCGYKADFISKIHCRINHAMEREEIEKKYSNPTDNKNRAKMSLLKWLPTQEQIDRAAKYGISVENLRNRGSLGWDPEKAITTPLHSFKECGQNGAKKSDFRHKWRDKK